MKIYRAPVCDVTDMAKQGQFKVNLPMHLGEKWVTYVSTMNNTDAGIFAPPTPNSEVLVLRVEGSDSEKEGAAGYYYLGSVVGNARKVASFVNDEDVTGDLEKSPESGSEVKLPGGALDFTSVGADAKSPPTMPLDVMDAYANQVTPEKMAFLDKGRNGLVLTDQKVGGEGGDSAWMKTGARLQSGDGKRIDLNATPAQDCIKMTTGGQVGEDYVLLGGKQDSIGAEGNTIQSGEFRVDSHGPSNLTSRERGIELRVKGKNLDIINEADGFFAPDGDGRYLIFPGGQDPMWPLEGDDEALGDIFGTDLSPEQLEEARVAAGGYLPLPKPSLISEPTGNAHPQGTGGLPGAKPNGGNPLDKGNEKYGNINIRSEWNNINIEGNGPDSVIHINAPYPETKVVVTTGGTVDIIATQKVSITSGEKIELNAPYIDLNSTVRVDID